jgi:hypothetical protein
MQPENKPPAPAPRPPAPSQTVRPQLRYRYSLTDGTLHALPPQSEPLSPATIVYNNIAATPLEESSTTIGVDDEPEAYDSIITLKNINVKTYLAEDIRNIAFKIGNAYSICTKDDIIDNCINSDSNIIFGCKKVDTSIVPRAENVIKDMPYINPRCFGIVVGLFRLSDIKTVLNDPTIRCIEVGDYPIDEKGVRAENAMPNKELVTVTSLSMLGRNPNALGALHCQDGQKMQVYSLRKMARPSVPAAVDVPSVPAAVDVLPVPAAVDVLPVPASWWRRILNRRGGSKQTRRIQRTSKRKHSKKQKQTKKRGARKTRRG